MSAILAWVLAHGSLIVAIASSVLLCVSEVLGLIPGEEGPKGIVDGILKAIKPPAQG